MFTINKQKGIGEIKEIANGMVTVYFEETDETKKLVEQYTTIYATREEAEIALNPEMTEQDIAEILERVEEEKRIMADGTKASKWLEAHNIEASKKLMKNI
jgi:pentose-5-phosphate-3-epimerase